MDATVARRLGTVFSFVEAGLLGVVTALHLGAHFHVAGYEYAMPVLYPAAAVDGLLALALLVAIAVPGTTVVRAGRVLAAQIFVVIGVFLSQLALGRLSLATGRDAIVYGVTILLALASIALVAAPAFRARTGRMVSTVRH